MDNLTHTLVGLTLARTPLARAGPGTLAVLVVASNLPDVEAVTALTSGRLAYLASHRGPTHGPIGVVGLALAAAVIVRWWRSRRRRTSPTGRFWPLVGVGLVATTVHVLLDVTTSYGTRVLSPFSDVWVGVDWMPILEPYLLGLLATGLLASRWRPAARGRVAAATLALAACLCAGRAALHEAAISAALEPPPTAPSADIPAGQRAARPPVVFRYRWPERPPALPAALPAAWSPFRWRVVREVGHGLELSEVDLLRGPMRREPVVHPRAAGPWVELAAQAPTPRVFVAFMRFPAVFVSHLSNGDVIVRWNDIRFAAVGAASRPDGSRPASHFGAWARYTADRRLVGHGLGSG